MAFTPAPSLDFSARAGETAEILVAYRFREASDNREDFDATLVVELPGREPEVAEARVNDRVGLPDEVHGTLVAIVPFPEAGDLEAAFRLESRVFVEPWGSPQSGAPTREVDRGRFRVRVH